jgi:hypothetical protein
MRSLVSAAAIATMALAACAIDPLHPDPVHQAEVDALGGEAPGVSPGPYHRAGQPCTVCHGPEGPAETRFVLAGTVFTQPSQPQGIGGVEVLMVDSVGSSPPAGSVITNCVGNFFVTRDLWDPAFPIRAAVLLGTTGAQMVSHIGRAGSCASCHVGTPTLDSPGRVYVGAPPSNASCPVDPTPASP